MRPKHTPPLTIAADLLRGRLHLTATYASSRKHVAPHTTKGKDDGTVESCTCEGWMAHLHCWHGDSVALDYFRWKWAATTLADLQRRDAELRHWLGLGPDAADEAAARIELTVVGDAIGERTAEQEAA